jgi:hypothetical protein
MRLATDEISRIISALKRAGCFQCIVIVNEAGYLQPLRPENELFDDGATCYLLSVEESELMAFNRKLGPFRSVLTDEAKSWAISCNESYNLFAGSRDLVEAFLGEPVEQARKEFLDFASMMAKGRPDEPLMQAAARYAAF